MSAPLRGAIAAAILVGGYFLSGAVRRLVAYADTNPGRLGFEMLGIEIGLAAVAIAIAFALPGSTSRRLGLGPSRLPTSAVIALALGTLGLSHAFDAALSYTRAMDGSVAVGISRGLVTARNNDFDFLIAFVGSVIGPAIGEELLCRGLLQRGLAQWMRPIAAIAISALAFGWLHQELVHGALAASIGLYLGFAAWWSDSTRPAIAGHAANNFVALLGSSGVTAVMMPRAYSLAIGIALAVFGIVWARRAGPPGVGSRPLPPALQPERSPADA